MDNQITIFGCPSTFLVVSTWNIYTYKGEFWLWIYGIYGCPSDNCISIVGSVVQRRFWLSRVHGYIMAIAKNTMFG